MPKVGQREFGEHRVDGADGEVHRVVGDGERRGWAPEVITNSISKESARKSQL